MRDSGASSEDLIKECLKLFILLFISIITRKVFSATVDYSEAIIDSVIIIISALLYLIIFSGYKLIQKPVKVMLELSNSINHENETILHHLLNNENRGSINLYITIEKRESIWNTLAMKFLKHSIMSIQIYASPTNKSIICQSCRQLEEIFRLEDQNGFQININQLLLNNLKDRVPLDQCYDFIVFENRDFPLQSYQKYVIKPMVIFNNKPLSMVLNFFFDFTIKNIDECYCIKLLK